MARETWVQSQVESYQRLKKWYLIPPCLTLRNYKVRVKWSNPGKGVAPSPTPWCSSYRKGSLRVTLDYGRQLYLLIWCTDKMFYTVFYLIYQQIVLYRLLFDVKQVVLYHLFFDVPTSCFIPPFIWCTDKLFYTVFYLMYRHRCFKKSFRLLYWQENLDRLLFDVPTSCFIPSFIWCTD